MQNPFQANLRKPWLLLCTTLLVVYSIAPGGYETLFFSNASGSFIEALMFLLSFPLGTAAVFLFHAADFGVMGRFAFWAAAMGIGYAQWFHLFPALLRRRAQTRFTTLNLPAAESVASGSPLGLGVTGPLHTLDPARPPVPQFNERGMTPLERIFRDEEE
ncbi:MAG: hypothetical protein QOJ70_2424 [Acidobacteriota bacterium]|jgi:hypothetical protein|nr:hypothetical protein [Acidobacteriota bacterium]